MATAIIFHGAPGSASASGMPWPRLHQSGSEGSKPRFLASVVTKMTPVRGTSRNAVMAGGSGGRTGGGVVDIERNLRAAGRGDNSAAALAIANRIRHPAVLALAGFW